MTASAKKRADEIVRDLILFDEHTWGSADSINLPDSLDTNGQFVEKAALAYMPMARAELLLSMRMRSKLDAEGEGLYVVNTAQRPVSEWVRFPKPTARRAFQSLEDAATGKPVPVDFERISDRVLPVLAPVRADAKPPEQADVARFWVENLGPASVLTITSFRTHVCGLMFRMRAACLFLLLTVPLAAKIEQIDLIATSHTDVGYTDQPSITRELQKRYLDIAIDACLRTAALPAGERFYWTAEATVSVLDWWNAASAERRAQFLQTVKSGQLEIAAMACNNTPFMDAQEWATAVRWLPDDLWRRVSPRVAMQDDVNGMPRAGAMQLLDRGVKRLMMGINVDSGGRPFRAPDAFWWKMPDGRRMFVYMGEHYGVAFSYFEANQWLVGPSMRAGNGLLRPPRPQEVLRSDEQSVRAAHKLCTGAAGEDGGGRV